MGGRRRSCWLACGPRCPGPARPAAGRGRRARRRRQDDASPTPSPPRRRRGRWSYALARRLPPPAGPPPRRGAHRRDRVGAWLRPRGRAPRAARPLAARRRVRRTAALARPATDRPTSTRTRRTSCPRRRVLVVDGVFAQRPELGDVWDLVVYVDAPDDVRLARMAERDGVPDRRRPPRPAALPRRPGDLPGPAADRSTEPTSSSTTPTPPRRGSCESPHGGPPSRRMTAREPSSGQAPREPDRHLLACLGAPGRPGRPGRAAQAQGLRQGPQGDVGADQRARRAARADGLGDPRGRAAVRRAPPAAGRGRRHPGRPRAARALRAARPRSSTR